MNDQSKVYWPAAVALLGVVATAGAVAVFAPQDVSLRIVAALSTIASGAIAAWSRGVFDTRTQDKSNTGVGGVPSLPPLPSVPPKNAALHSAVTPPYGTKAPPIPPPRSRKKNGGFARVDAIEGALLTALLATVAALVVASLNGCGASAVRQHASAATIAITAEQGARAAIISATRDELDACPTSEPDRTRCIESTEQRALVAGAAHDALRPVLAAYRDAVLAASSAEDSEMVRAALVAAAVRVVREWESLRAALAAMGADLPALPLIGGAQ